jgi:hypothetical protein
MSACRSRAQLNLTCGISVDLLVITVPTCRWQHEIPHYGGAQYILLAVDAEYSRIRNLKSSLGDDSTMQYH